MRRIIASMAVIYRSHYRSEIPSLTVNYSRLMRSRGGLARPQRLRVALNARLMREHPDQLEQILIHEICHILTWIQSPYARSHGSEWRSMMRTMGREPDRCHEMPTAHLQYKQKRFEVVCACRSHVVSARLLRKIEAIGANYTCRSCGQRVSRKEPHKH